MTGALPGRQSSARVAGALAALMLVAWAAPALAAGAPGAVDARDSHAIFILLDGARADTVYGLLAAGKLPNIAKHIVNRGLEVEHCTTVFPSTTGPAYAPFVIGLFPEKSGLPGIRWWDRTTGRSIVYAGTDFGHINTDLTSEHKTIYELVGGSSVAVFGMVDRGVGQRVMPTVGLVWTKVTGGILGIDRLLFSSFMDKALGKAPVPRFMFLSLHGADSTGHAKGVEDPDYAGAIVQADGFVGRIASRLTELGIYDSTYWVVSADHGQTSATQHLSLADALTQKLGLDVRDSIGRVTNFYNARAGSQQNKHDVHLEVSGNACVQAYLCPFGGDPKERVDAAAACDLATRAGSHVDIAKAMLDLPAVELVCSHADQGRYRVQSRDGAAQITRDGDGHAYQVLSGTDPLGYTSDPHAAPLVGGAMHSSAQWLAATAASTYPDAVVQIAQLMESPRAGDIVISATPGWEPWTEGQAGVHGGLRKEHMLVPLLMAGPGVRTGLVPCARTADVFPTLLEMLGLPAQQGIDGSAINWRQTGER